MTCFPFGTCTVNEYVALSAGLSFTGNQVGAPYASLATIAPCGVEIQPNRESVLSIGRPVVPEYVTRTVTVRPFASECVGRTRSFSALWAKCAFFPATVTFDTC